MKYDGIDLGKSETEQKTYVYWKDGIHYPDGIEVKRGRPATGRTTVVCRVPIDTNVPLMVRMYHEWLPILEEYRSIARENPQAVRNEKLVKLLEELGSW